MLACMLGANREIFFPKLEKAQMMTFDRIAEALLREMGYTVLECGCDREAVDGAGELKKGSNLYPVFFSGSDTSGEKTYEEFYTDQECIDQERYLALGVITGKIFPDRERIDALLESLERAFMKKETTKEEIVAILTEYFPDFHHMETGKSLDSKM